MGPAGGAGGIVGWSGCNKYHRLLPINKRCLFLTGLEAGKSKIKGLANLRSGESFLGDG